MTSGKYFDNKVDHTVVNAFIQKEHSATFQFLIREGAEIIGGNWRMSASETIYPGATELVLQELAAQSPPPSKSEYVDEFDEKIEFLKKWIANKGVREN